MTQNIKTLGCQVGQKKKKKESRLWTRQKLREARFKEDRPVVLPVAEKQRGQQKSVRRIWQGQRSPPGEPTDVMT